MNLSTKGILEIKGDFFVPRYQRGYRWSTEEVTLLLEDIINNGCHKNYCLQPIVVKNNINQYELIDGQQRLTTLYILLICIKKFLPMTKVNFSIAYETRSETEIFLGKLNENRSTEELKKESDKNIDFHFIYTAYETINKWISNRKDPQGDTINLYNILNNNVKVIWYEADKEVDSIDLFTRLNIGRIPLTNAELVRALFLSRNNGIDEYRQIEIASEWDRMEQELRDDSFWYFVTNEKTANYQTRIELLFNLLASREKNCKEKYFTFFFFNAEIQKIENKYDSWKNVIFLFLKLKEWYKNRSLYHKVGYLIASRNSTLKELLIESDSKKKKEFQSMLDEFIAQSIKYDKAFNELEYTSHYDKIQRILLLFNVESILKNKDNTLRFPFDKYKKESWSLEHIHAQNSEGLNTREKQKEWLRLHLESLNKISATDNKTLITEIESAIADENLKIEIFDRLLDKTIQRLSPDSDHSYMHQLSNMALLKTNNNAALNNAAFDVKRNKIIKLDKDGEFIPFCTRMVFLKYYTLSEVNQLHFWGEADRDAYMQAINDTLAPYINLTKDCNK